MTATITLDELTMFVTVVRTGSFTAAAHALATQKAHASRVVSRLERRLGVRLLQRSTRSLATTEAGRDLFVRATAILSALEEAEASVQRSQSAPQGVLRLTCGTELGMTTVNGWICDYLKRYPAVRVDADFTDRVVDLIHEGFDLAIRVGRLSDSSLSVRSLGAIHYALYASPDYLRDNPPPKHPDALAAHTLVMFAVAAPAHWRLARGEETATVAGPSRFVVNNHLAARDATLDGLGIALLPRFQARPFADAGQLVEILPGWTRPPAPVNAVFPSSRYLSPKVRAFIDIAVAGTTAAAALG